MQILSERERLLKYIDERKRLSNDDIRIAMHLLCQTLLAEKIHKAIELYHTSFPNNKHVSPCGALLWMDFYYSHEPGYIHKLCNIANIRYDDISTEEGYGAAFASYDSIVLSK